MKQISDKPPNIVSVAELVENLNSATSDEMVPDTLLRRLWAKGQEVPDRLANTVRKIAQG